MKAEKKRPLIIGIGGTLRLQSTGQKALTHVLARAEDFGAQTELISGQALDLLREPRVVLELLRKDAERLW